MQSIDSAKSFSGSFEAVLSSVLERSEEQLPTDASARRVYAAVLSQVVGGRNWSAQEVGHVNMGCSTVVASHKLSNTSNLCSTSGRAETRLTVYCAF